MLSDGPPVLGGEDEQPRIGARLVALKRVLLRVGVEKTSPCTEILHPGSTIVVLQTGRNNAGQTRVRCRQGWISLRAESGEELLEPASERANEAAAAAVDAVQAALPRDSLAEAHTKPPDSAVPVAAKDERAAATVSVGTAADEEAEGQLSPPASVAKSTAATAAAPASPAAGTRTVEPAHPPASTPASTPASAPAPVQDAVDASEVTRLTQQLELAHQELARLKAASTTGTMTSVELAKAAVQLTASAYGNGGGPSLSPPSVPLLSIDRSGPVPSAGTWAGGMSPFARARRHQAEMMTARQSAWTLGSTAGKGPAGLGPSPASQSPRPATASPDNGWGSSRQRPGSARQAVTRGQGSYGNGTPRSRSTSRSVQDRLDSDPLVLGEARQVSGSLPSRASCTIAAFVDKRHDADLTRLSCVWFVAQVKIDGWIDEWCVRQGIAGHAGVVRMGLEKAQIEPQDWVTTLRNLS